MKFGNDLITFLTGVSRQIAVDQCGRIIYFIYFNEGSIEILSDEDEELNITLSLQKTSSRRKH